MNLFSLPAGPIYTNGYLLTSPERGEAVLIDAPGEIWAQVKPILQEEKCRLTELWLTHGHWDHMQGGAEIVRETGAKVLAHRDDETMLAAPQRMEVFMGMKLSLEPVNVDRWIAQGDRLEALGTQIEIRHVPGHCPGSVAFYFAKEGVIFDGDTLFAGAIGRTDLPGGDYETLVRGITEQLYTLPEATVVYPGHGPATTVGQEKQTNPYVRG